MGDPVSAGVAAIAAGAVAKKAGETLADRMLGVIGSVKKTVASRIVVSFRLGFENYLSSSYLRCRYYKTVLNPYEPADLEETYIPLRLNIPRRHEHLEDKEIFSKFYDGDRLVVTGLAGSGKSMLMKYLTLESFKNLSAGIPLFVELRKINEYKDKNLIDFILHQCTPKDNGITLDQFNLALREGLFTFILDGFDELEYEHRDEISEQIVALERDYPSLRVIVSSRPDDDRFRAWESFTVYQVSNFTQKQAVELINKTKYNEGVKERFLKAMNDRLFKSHETFLSSPLLTTIMLLTFEEYAEIPTKMHAFYARAFDTLFQKHDADKDQFVRKIKANLGKEDFKLAFSVFCAMSYIEQRFSFNQELGKKTASEALAYAKQISPDMKPVKPDDFLCDLTDAVCMLQPDGLDLTFVHRSFQEYFSAVFIEKSHGERVKSLLDRFAHRFNDNVIGMALEMAREKVEAEWIYPTIERYLEIIRRKNGRRDVGNVFKTFLPEAELRRVNDSVHFSFFSTNDDNLGALESICKVYPKELGGAFLIKTLRSINIEFIKRELLKSDNARKGNYTLWRQIVAAEADDRIFGRVKFSRRENWWMSVLGVNDMFDELVGKFEKINDGIKRRERARNKIISQFL